ncbi:MAG TPA: aminoacyl-tRNA hydrolase [Bacteroidales bacterium]|jgi:PTH1 family peptidyl-tRNA hydrolase|nr:aminoacyl-tRNA hydrolase [Bacteroidales bacterium]HOB26752.1 aminoacyl-tRNA hydrolase [Bacteroidales bacterium]HPU46436.1 aminoacyl-tRNA hydrolase [Bacteroidales bacterium]HPZ35944.1 aminoacyl-tRNA hydrolase [Bacteroidales bacterium]HQD34386.1 aminoacyl-tRNA hydrolase [Bacteroidales bacterium]
MADNSYLVVGLGNIGYEYEHSRHNIGFDVLDYFVEKYSSSFKQDRYVLRADVKIKNKLFICIKPTTYMNLSGKAVNYWLKILEIPLSNIIIIYDDFELPLGKIRIKAKGSAGTHKGLENIIETLRTEQIPRMRIGIDNNFLPGQQIDYVLEKWPKDQWEKISKVFPVASDALYTWAFEGIDRAMNKYNNIVIE